MTRDVVVEHTLEFDPPLFPELDAWAVQRGDSHIIWFATEPEARSFQRGWRVLHGLHPETGKRHTTKGYFFPNGNPTAAKIDNDLDPAFFRDPSDLDPSPTS